LAVLLTVSLALFMGPLLFFIGPLARAREPGTLALSRFSERCVQTFGRKWIAPGAASPRRESVLNPDISAMADLITTSTHASRMSILLPDRETIAPFVMACLFPLLPLLLPKISMSVLLEAAKKIFL
jgi:hypothetical protein